MAQDRSTITIDISDAIAGIDRIASSGRNTDPLMKSIASILEEGVRQNFDNEMGPDGPWVPLQPVTLAARSKKGYDGKKLQRSRTLYNSILPYSGKDEAYVATNVLYAPIQFLGGTSGMPPGPAAVPARNPMWINDETRREIDAEIDDWFGG